MKEKLLSLEEIYNLAKKVLIDTLAAASASLFFRGLQPYEPYK